MKTQRWLFVIALVIGMVSDLTLLLGCEGDFDDDDDDDDSQGDDDSAGDDDDNDAGPPDWSLEPLAVLNCGADFADPNQEILFDGSLSVDPMGDALEYRFDFGDGAYADSMNAVHAFDLPGAYRVTLTVTNGLGLSDVSYCLVQVGAFPAGPGELDGFDYRPNFFNPEIIEPNPPGFAGGTVFGFFSSPESAAADTVLINGSVGHPDTADVEWCEVINPSVVAEGVAIMQCHSYDPGFGAGKPIDLEVRAGETTLWVRSGVLPQPTLTPSYITANVAGDEVLVYIRNDSDAVCTVSGLSIDGLDVSDFVVVDNPDVSQGGMAVIRIPRRDGIDYGVFHVYTLQGICAKGEVEASRPIRLFPPVFPLGNWDASADDVFHNLENLEQQLDHGIDMHIYYPSPYEPPELVMDLAETYEFTVFTHRDATDPYFDQFVAEYGDNPHVLTNAVFGEPDLNHRAIEALPHVRLQRDLWDVKKPLWGYNACAHRWPSFQALPDIGGMDHYCVFAPKCNYNWPLFFWDHLWFLGYYAESAKRNSEPRPIWEWTQGNSWGSIIGEYVTRCLTDEEIRAQWHVLLGRGVKGLLWFRFTREYIEHCPGPLPAMAGLADELGAIKDSLLEGDWYTTGVYATTDVEHIDIQATLSPNAAVIVLTNFDYELNLIAPWQWHEKYDVTVDFYPTEWFEPETFFLLSGGESIPLDGEKVNHGHWRFVVPSLVVGNAVMIEPEP